MFATILMFAVSFAPALPVRAQDVTPFEFNMDRVKVVKKGQFASSKVYAIPTVYLHVEARNTAFAKNDGAQVKARVFIEGLDKALLQGLAKKIYEDLIAKVRAAGYTVLTYDDLKADLAGLDRMEPNPKYGLSTKLLDKSLGVDFVIASPSDEQTFDYGITGPVRSFKDVAKGKDAVVLVPVLHFTAPQVEVQKSGMFDKTVKLDLHPQLVLYKATVSGLPPDLGWCSIDVQQHGKRFAADPVGATQKLDEDKTKFGEWSRTVADFAFVLDPKALAAGVLRVGFALNDLTADTIKKAH